MTVPSRDGQPVLAALAEAAARLAGSPEALIYRKDGDQVRLVARHGPAGTEGPGGDTGQLVRSTIQGRAILDGRTIRAGGLVATPMLRNGTTAGVIVVRRGNSRSFSSAQADRLEAFAVQAAVVIQELEERDRELADTAAQYAATAEIVRAISSSTNIGRVFDMIAENAVKLCAGQFCLLYRFDGTLLHFVAHHGLSPEGADAVRRTYPIAPARTSAAARCVLSCALEHIPDVDADPDYGHGALARTIRYKSIVGVPMVRDGVPIGAIAVARVEAGPFPNRQLALLKTFADQAVIAIENVRLFTELEAKNRWSRSAARGSR
jgi:two-component system, NtrC family, sensor kinase